MDYRNIMVAVDNSDYSVHGVGIGIEISKAFGATLTGTHVYAARLHDLGKIGINDAILKKPGLLSPEERKDMERHSEIGASILGYFPLFSKGVAFLLHHHERYDGEGYPDGLKGERIPIGARIVAVIDAFDAMTTDRPYREALSLKRAWDVLKDGAGGQWDPTIVRVFMEAVQVEGWSSDGDDHSPGEHGLLVPPVNDGVGHAH